MGHDRFAVERGEEFVETHSLAGPPATMMAVSMRVANAEGIEEKKSNVQRPAPDVERREEPRAIGLWLNVGRFLHPNCRCTSWLSVLPSARPATFGPSAFITALICARDVAPTSAIVSLTSRAISSTLIAAGK